MKQLRAYITFLTPWKRTLLREDCIAIGVDGKEIEEAGESPNTLHVHRNLSHLNVYDSGTATSLYFEQGDEKENEIADSQKILRT